MAQWTLKTLNKKSATTLTFMSKDSQRICINEKFRWGAVFLETEGDGLPVVDLKNPDGINTYNIPDTEWELDSFDDGWLSEIQSIKGTLSEEQLEELEELFFDEGIPGLEEDGWEDEGECEWWFYGPLQLEDEAGNIVDQGVENGNP